MTERSDRIERPLDLIAKRLDQTVAQQQQNIIDVADNIAGELPSPKRPFSSSQRRLRRAITGLIRLKAEGIANRQETRQLFNDAVN